MNDPYQTLGVSPTATDEEIKTAYRELAKKYHPDQYNGTPLADLASEKMKEINMAYDTIVSERKKGGYNSQSYGYNSNYGNGSSGYSSGGYSTKYSDVRNYINLGRNEDAEQILDGVPSGSRDPEWYFLKGTIFYKKGWMEQAKNYFTRAYQMEPNNQEYRSAYMQSVNQRNGYYGGYNPNIYNNNSNCNACDLCSTLMCADCCCESMGGDLIPCC
jgi:molecular chaperone DnaJ